jgi:hypothetical protein
MVCSWTCSQNSLTTFCLSGPASHILGFVIFAIDLFSLMFSYFLLKRCSASPKNINATWQMFAEICELHFMKEKYYKISTIYYRLNKTNTGDS